MLFIPVFEQKNDYFIVIWEMINARLTVSFMLVTENKK